ncbi:DUF4192 domain-containing protein [Saccharothrix hoggarensis]|uniref:DUF4192 domain-containing protein n=1 Tax=Saccharothrix hoggarensis TaxID=913853 RepID=A0ABW3QEP4_9PSEU
MTKLLPPPPPPPAARLVDAGNVIAAVPHLLGFHPADSLVVLVLRAGDVAMGLRVDLPSPARPGRVAKLIAGPLARCRDATAVVVVVGGGSGDPPEHLPHAAVVDEVDDALHAARVPLVLAVWTRAVVKGEAWFDYHDAGTHGTVTDPTSTALAAASAADGFVTHASREAMAELLAPDPPEALSRRAALLNRRAANAPPVADGAVPPSHLDLIHAEVVRAAGRKRSLTDDEVADLAHALSNPWTRDASLGYCVGEHALGAEVLWTELTRASPAPERAEPATLLAFSAYIRGQGTLASLALERAEEAHPGHRLTELLRAALNTGLPPEQLRELAEHAAGATWTTPPSP